jgi:hypothetical protein
VFCDGSFDGFRIGTVDDIHLLSLHEIMEGRDGSYPLPLHQFGGIGRCITNHLSSRQQKEGAISHARHMKLDSVLFPVPKDQAFAHARYIFVGVSWIIVPSERQHRDIFH